MRFATDSSKQRVSADTLKLNRGGALGYSNAPGMLR